MLTLKCATVAGAAKPPQSYHKYRSGNSFERYGHPYFALVACDVSLADAYSLDEWKALVDSGDIVISPKCRILTPAPTSVTSNEVDVCAGAVVLETTFQLQVATYQITEEDCDYWDDIAQNASNYRIMWFDCQEKVTLSNEYIDFLRDPIANPDLIGNPGLAFSVSQTPFKDAGDGNMKRWNTTFEVVYPGSRVLRDALVPGLFAQLAAEPAVAA